MIFLKDELDSENTSLYIQIYDYFKNEIIKGNIENNTRIPSVRKFAESLGISTTPVEMAYDQLVAEGFIISMPRKGYYVQKSIDTIQNDADLIQFKKESILPRNMKFTYDFHISKNDFNYFPFKTWKRLYGQCLDIDQKDLLFYGDPQGEEGLRKEIARYLRKYRGVQCNPDQIIIGAEQHQLASILSLILKPHSTKLAIENPSYPLVFETFKQSGYEVFPIKLEEDGIDINMLYRSGAKIAYVSPSHQYPKGMLMSISKRLKLLSWAREVDGYIIEDDYDGEFRYHGRPIPSLQGIIPNSNVIYMGSFSQVLAPAICIYYMVLPEALTSVYRNIKFTILFEQASSRLHQRTMQLFMEKGYLERHMRKMKLIYKKKHDITVESLKKHFGSKINILGRNAGFHLFLEIEHDKREDELKAIAEKSGIRISPAYYTYFSKEEGKKREFILGFAGIEEDKIDEGIELLRNIWFP